MVERIRRLVEAPAFNRVVLGLIVAAAVIVGLETSRPIMAAYGPLIYALDWLVVGLFALEAILKMASHGRRFDRYFHDPWNVFDFTIVVLCLLPVGGHSAAVLRLARVFRALRLISAVPKLQILVISLLKSLPSMVHVGVLLGILFYVYAVLGVFLWRDNDPVHFRDLSTALLTLFRVVTLEDWSDVMYIQMNGSAGHGFTAAEMSVIAGYDTYQSVARPVLGAGYFVSFVLFGTMIMLNLFIGVIINSMNEAQAEAEIILRRRQGVPETSREEHLRQIDRKLQEIQQTVELLRKT